MALPFAFSLLRRAPPPSSSSLAKYSSLANLLIRSKYNTQKSGFIQCELFPGFRPRNQLWVYRNLSYGSVNLVVSEGKPKFESHEVDPPKKDKWKNKKRFKLQKKREKDKRKAANKRDPRWLGGKGKKKKQKFNNAEERINSKLDKARIKESMLIERLKRYEVPKVQGPQVEPHNLTGEELFYLKRMGQKRSNYAPVGRRGIFGGVILNMHMHWKKHETVKVICKPCKPGQVQEYAEEIARLSGGVPVQIIGDNTIIFYRGKNYVQPEVMSPTDTLSKKRALEKSKYEQSLESVRRFIAIAEKELELYYRHIALYGEPNKRNPLSILNSSNIDEKDAMNVETGKKECQSYNDGLSAQNHEEPDSGDEMSETKENIGDEVVSFSESDAEDDGLSCSDMEQTRDSSYTEDAKEMESSSSV